MKRILKIMIATILIIGASKIHVLHQNLPSGRCYFSLSDAIESDIAERQLNTPYFIATSIKDLF